MSFLSDITYQTIPKGTKLYRSASRICPYKNRHLHRKECPDTGKRGVYFSTYVLQSLAMAIEYGEDLELGVFETTAPIRVMNGKYAFRYIQPDYYFQEDGSLFINKSIRKIDNVSHIDQNYPIIEMKNQKIIYDRPLGPKSGEVFLASMEDLKKVKMVKTYRFSVDDLKGFIKVQMKKEGYIPLHNNTFYLRSGILEPLDCGKRVAKTRKKKVGNKK